MENIHSFSKRYFLSLDESLNINWSGSGLPLEQEIEINGESIKPYVIAMGIVDSWLENIKEVTAGNIEKSSDRAIFNAAFNRISKKIFPTLISYLLPSIEFEGKEVIKTKKASPASFWKEAWPQVWNEFSKIERGLISKFTTLNKDTSYDEIMKSLGSTLSDSSPYKGYKPLIGQQVKLFYDMMGNGFSQMFNNEKVSLNNDLILALGNDLNSNINGSKIDFGIGKKEDVKGNLEKLPSKDISKVAQKGIDSVVQTLSKFTEKAFDPQKSKDNADTASKDSGEAEDKGDNAKASTGGSADQPAYPTDVQSIRKWAKTLNPVDKRVIIDTLRSTL